MDEDWTGFYEGWGAREDHCRATGHVSPEFECDTRDASFNSGEACLQHMDAEKHYVDEDSTDYESNNIENGIENWDCAICGYGFTNYNDCFDHKVVDHLYCWDCDRTFSTYCAINDHLDSSVHRSRTVHCPLCNTTDTHVGAIALHVESGRCPGAPNMNRDEMRKLVRSNDPDERISRRSIFGDDQASAIRVKYSADKTTWNGKNGYKCYFCSRAFKLLAGLNSHLNSDAHGEILYHCPNNNCGSEFTSLTSAIQHLESQRCGSMCPAKTEKLLVEILTDQGPISC